MLRDDTSSRNTRCCHQRWNKVSPECAPPTVLQPLEPISYLFVGSGVGLPEALHFAEGDVRTVGQATQECARGLLTERHLQVLVHGRLRGWAFAQTQGPRLQLIMQLHGIHRQVALP